MKKEIGNVSSEQRFYAKNVRRDFFLCVKMEVWIEILQLHAGQIEFGILYEKEIKPESNVDPILHPIKSLVWT